MQLFALPEHLCPQQVFRGVGVTKSFVSCLVICRSVFVFFFDQCIDRPFSMSGFWLPLCCLQTFRESTFYWYYHISSSLMLLFYTYNKQNILTVTCYQHPPPHTFISVISSHVTYTTVNCWIKIAVNVCLHTHFNLS